MEMFKNIELKKYTSWLIGGPADYFCLPTKLEDLKEALLWAKEKNHEVTLLSGGSNVLISDLGIRGLTICLKDFNKYEIKISNNNIKQAKNNLDQLDQPDETDETERLVIKAQAGMSKTEALKIFLKHRLAPALFLAGIPGDLGGGVVMNAGVSELSIYPREMCEIVDQIEVLRDDLTLKTYSNKEIQWAYRHSLAWQPGIITEVQLSWPNRPEEGLLEKVKAANLNRMNKQPLDFPSCGSVFRNPTTNTDLKAAQLIDSCGLKSYRIGEAQVSPKHANFIINLGRAQAKDVASLIEHIQKVVFNEKGIQLKTEVIRLGDWKN